MKDDDQIEAKPLTAVDLQRGVMPLADEMESIIKSLEKECAYSDDDIKDMLKSATFRCHDGGVDITYENGVVDKFIYIKVLVHLSEAHKVRLWA